MDVQPAGRNSVELARFSSLHSELVESGNPSEDQGSDHGGNYTDDNEGSDITKLSEHVDGLIPGMDPSGFAGPSQKTILPLTPEALAGFQAAQERTGIVYISRIPPGMQPPKVRHLMSAYGEVGRVYLQREDPKRAHLRRKFTSTKKPHYTEGWVEFKDKKVARSVAAILNAQPIGGKKGTRWRDDVWTMKYLPKFKWNMLTEQIAQEAALHVAKLRVELAQSKSEQKEYLRNVELARVLEKRAKRKGEPLLSATTKRRTVSDEETPKPFRHLTPPRYPPDGGLDNVLENIF